MIERLYVKNVALIAEMEMEFSKGLNILSGETGAGKSMIIDSINFLLGGRASKDFIRSGAEEALVEGFLVVGQEEVREAIGDHLGIILEDDNALLISRTVSRAGKGSIRINGKSATVGMLREAAALLVDVHSQHEHQSLLKPSKHIELLDKLADEKMVEDKQRLSVLIKEYKELEEKIASLSVLEKDGSSKLDFLKFQIDEIIEAALKPGEEEELSARHKVLLNTERLMEGCRDTIELLYGGDGGSAMDQVAKAMAIAGQISEMDDSQEELPGRMEEIIALIDDIVRDVRRYGDMLEHDPAQLAEIESRLELIYHLKRKYGNSVEEILDKLEKFTEEYDFLVNSAEILEKYHLGNEKLLKDIWKICGRLTKYRKDCAKEIRKNIEDNLKELGMKDARFEIQIVSKEQFGFNGSDQVEFMISPNAGEPLRPLAKIASGGEMSRVMLALKTVLADGETIETFIFDEIDTGVSGRTAQKVGEKLSLIAKKQQILCITHLPQIAAMADSHFLIEKSSDKKSTLTTVSCLDEKAIIQELARLIGGAKITEATMAAATEIKAMADSWK